MEKFRGNYVRWEDEFIRNLDRLEVEDPSGEVWSYVPISKEEYFGKLRERVRGTVDELFGGNLPKDFFEILFSDELKDSGTKERLKEFFMECYGVLNSQASSHIYFVESGGDNLLAVKRDLLLSDEFSLDGRVFRVYRKDGAHRERRMLYKLDNDGKPLTRYQEVTPSTFIEAVESLKKRMEEEAWQTEQSMDKAVSRLKFLDEGLEIDHKYASFNELMKAVRVVEESVKRYPDSREDARELDSYIDQLLGFLEDVHGYVQSLDAWLTEGMIYFLSDDGELYYCTEKAYEIMATGRVPGWTTRDPEAKEQGSEESMYL